MLILKRDRSTTVLVNVRGASCDDFRAYISRAGGPLEDMGTTFAEDACGFIRVNLDRRFLQIEGHTQLVVEVEGAAQLIDLFVAPDSWFNRVPDVNVASIAGNQLSARQLAQDYAEGLDRPHSSIGSVGTVDKGVTVVENHDKGGYTIAGSVMANVVGINHSASAAANLAQDYTKGLVRPNSVIGGVKGPVTVGVNKDKDGYGTNAPEQSSLTEEQVSAIAYRAADKVLAKLPERFGLLHIDVDGSVKAGNLPEPVSLEGLATQEQVATVADAVARGLIDLLERPDPEGVSKEDIAKAVWGTAPPKDAPPDIKAAVMEALNEYDPATAPLVEKIKGLTGSEVGKIVSDTLLKFRLDRLLATPANGSDVANNSVVAKLVSAKGNADWDSYDNTQHSLEAAQKCHDSV